MTGTSDRSEIDHAVFRRVVGLFTTGVTVITVQHGDHVHGMTANSFTSVSLDPPLVLFCVSKTARMAKLIEQTPGFAISILTSRQQHVSRQFASSRKDDLVRTVVLERGPVAPLIDGALASMSCTTEAIYEGGDHWIVVGRVVALHERADASKRSPLVFFRSRYCDLLEPGPAGTEQETWSNDEIRVYHDEWSAGDPRDPAERPELPW